MSYPLWLIDACEHRWRPIGTDRLRCLGPCGTVLAGRIATDPPQRGMDWGQAALVAADRLDLGPDVEHQRAIDQADVAHGYPYVWRRVGPWARRPGERCRIGAGGRLRVRVEAADGRVAVAWRWALRRSPA